MPARWMGNRKFIWNDLTITEAIDSIYVVATLVPYERGVAQTKRYGQNAALYTAKCEV